MATVPAPHTTPQPATPDWWRVPLLVGVCFGFGYGVVQRLMAMEFAPLVQLGQSFEVREFPGTTLEALRLRSGAEVQSIRGDLGVLELEEQENRKARPIEPALEPAPLITPRPAPQQRFTEPLDTVPDPEPVQPEPLPLPEGLGEGLDQVTP